MQVVPEPAYPQHGGDAVELDRAYLLYAVIQGLDREHGQFPSEIYKVFLLSAETISRNDGGAIKAHVDLDEKAADDVRGY